MITSRELNKFEGDLDMIKVDVNDKLRYWDGDGLGVSQSRSGWVPIPGRIVFNNAVRARALADQLIAAADDMDLRLQKALEELHNREI